MKKNIKGFTLVELLATIVIIGILAVVSVPMIMRLIDNSRDKTYISDAKKLISQADSEIRTNNVTLEIPDEGNCIIVSLVYLDNVAFDNPPHGGKYQKENSFVVIKNLGNDKLEYSVVLVEKYKNNYKGVKLTKEEDLNSKDATKNIVSYDTTSLVNASNVTVNYINQILGNGYVNQIEARYNRDEVY